MRRSSAMSVLPSIAGGASTLATTNRGNASGTAAVSAVEVSGCCVEVVNEDVVADTFGV